MVVAITPISAMSPSAVAQIWSSISIADPKNAWVAARQSQISSDRLALKAAETSVFGRGYRSWDLADDDARDRRNRARRLDTEKLSDPDDDLTDAKLSGESERIGTAYFDEDTPFGERFAIV